MEGLRLDKPRHRLTNFDLGNSMATTIQREGLPTQEMHEVHRIDHEGAIDADGHILEPPDLWDEYLESKYKDRALRIRLDEDGLEELEIGGERSTMSRRGFPATLGAMGAADLADIQRNPERTYLHEAPFGSMDPAQSFFHENKLPFHRR